jgi:hypothetical protein
MLAFIGRLVSWATAMLGFGRSEAGAIAPLASAIPLTTAALGSREPERALSPVGPSPEPASLTTLRPDRAGSGPVAEPNPTLALLRRRAFGQLFDHFGLSMIPSEAWSALDKSMDPVSAFRDFSDWVGCDVERIRRNDSAQLARMRTAIDLLVNLHPIRGHLSVSGADRIKRALALSPDAELEQAAQRIEALSMIQGCRSRAEGLQTCAAYERFAGIIDAECSDPLAMTPKEIAEAVQISDRFLRAMHSYTAARAKIIDTAEAIRGRWAEKSPASDDLDTRDGILFRAEDLDRELERNADLRVVDVEEFTEECADLCEAIFALYHRYGSDDGPAADEPYTDEREEALRFFGFPPGSSPSNEEIKRKFRAMWKKYNVDDPSHRTTEAQRLENERWLKDINKV